MEEFLHRTSGRLIAVGGGGGKEMHPAMDIGVLALGEIAHGIQHNTRLLGAGAGVQIDQRLAIDLARQDLKVGAGAFGVEGKRDFRLRCHAITFSAVKSSVRTNSRWSMLAISAMASSRNACSSKPRAWLSGMPRARR